MATEAQAVKEATEEPPPILHGGYGLHPFHPMAVTEVTVATEDSEDPPEQAILTVSTAVMELEGPEASEEKAALYPIRSSQASIGTGRTVSTEVRVRRTYPI